MTAFCCAVHCLALFSIEQRISRECHNNGSSANEWKGVTVCLDDDSFVGNRAYVAYSYYVLLYSIQWWWWWTLFLILYNFVDRPDYNSTARDRTMNRFKLRIALAQSRSLFSALLFFILYTALSYLYIILSFVTTSLHDALYVCISLIDGLN